MYVVRNVGNLVRIHRKRTLSAIAFVGALLLNAAFFPALAAGAEKSPPIKIAVFDFELEDRGGVGHDKLMLALNQLIALAQQDPALALVRPNGLPDNPTFKVDMDREKASALGVAVSDVDQTFSISCRGTTRPKWRRIVSSEAA